SRSPSSWPPCSTSCCDARFIGVQSGGIAIKTSYLYTCTMRLLNVRLGDDDARLVRRLRDRGVSISDVVRGAIRAEANRLSPRHPRDPDALLRDIRERYPSPSSPEKPAVRSTDRRAVQRLIRSQLRSDS